LKHSLPLERRDEARQESTKQDEIRRGEIAEYALLHRVDVYRMGLMPGRFSFSGNWNRAMISGALAGVQVDCEDG
jgi:hypothetical protein